MKKTLLVSLTLMLLCAACGKKNIIDDTRSFAGNRWMRFEPEVFKVDIKNTDKQYIITTTLTYDTTVFNANELPLVVDFFADSNEMHNFLPSMKLRNRNGSPRGTMLAQFHTVTDTIDRCRTFNKPGTYTYRIKQGTSKYELNGISSLNLKVSEL